jgi:hypothetical protein
VSFSAEMMTFLRQQYPAVLKKIEATFDAKGCGVLIKHIECRKIRV